MQDTYQVLSHEYAVPDDYNVGLSAVDLCGASAISHPVAAVFSATQASVRWLNEELTGTFTTQSTGRFPLSLLSDFGAGVTNTLTPLIHDYSLPVLYDVTLNATDMCGSGIFTDQVTTTCTAPTAFFTCQNDDLLVSFTNLSRGTQLLTYQWNFGDGAASIEQSPTLNTLPMADTLFI